MAKKRVHEIAKSQGMTSKEVLAKLQAAGLEVKAAASSVEEADALEALGNGAAPAAEQPAASAKPAAAAKPDGAPKADAPAPAPPAATPPRPAAPAQPAAAPPPAAQNEPSATQAPEAKQPPRSAPGSGPRIIQPTPPGDRPAPGTGPRIISGPEPAERPKRDESANQPGGAGRRPSRGGMQGERAPGGGAGGRRRVVIDSQASRRPGGPGGGPGGPGGPPGPQQRGPRRRGRRRREVLAEVAPELDVKAQQRTDVVRINSGSTVKDVAEYLGVPTPEIIKKLMGLGEMATLTQTLSDDAIHVLAEEFDKEVEIVHVGDDIEAEPAFADEEADLTDRPPVVTIMGHVDHGKTSLLDAIRQTQVVAGEAGGITQHIGAYQVTHNDKPITFLDTPGHEAFTAMRARGARVTDLAVIVVAADDGAKPQTDEAIDHAKAAEVPILVAVNKIDKEGADPTRVRTEPTQRNLQPSEWGGETEFVDVSAKTQQGLEDLLDTILVVSELEELKANPKADASGVVIESKLDPGRGPVATLLIQRGHLEVGDAVVAGPT
ncbi:MAG: translation initiation factor IF-2, partial [Solirubrobacteraceae bacterium]